jgi:hypothetical protein
VHGVRELRAGHRWHDFVGQQEVEALRIGAKRGKRNQAVVEPDRLEPKLREHFLAESYKIGFVVDKQDAFPVAAWQCAARRLLPVGAILDPRKVDLEPCARAEPVLRREYAGGGLRRVGARDAGAPAEIPRR